ncbi:MAG: NfeD family protein [Mariprofundaceae bacterium]|nr:NfeD family protein [Mariprofundaceae bacterium]
MEHILSNSYYFWGGLAVLLLLAEAATFTSVALVFSIAASVVFLSLLFADVPESMAGQILLFATSGAALFLPIRWLQKRTATQNTTGDVATSLADAPEGVVKSIEAGGHSGRVALEYAFLGEREWMFKSDQPVQAGDRVNIADVRGNIIKVSAKTGE